MITFRSIVVLDLETTSLPENDHNTTKIIELAVLGCEIDHVKYSRKLPRVLHKLVLLFNPEKAIYPESSLVSGLSNELLMNIQPFTENDAEILNHFISRLPSPVCLVAHNGDRFDFPILRRALHKINKTLPTNIYCADSLKAFMELIPSSKKSFDTKGHQMLDRNKTTPEGQRTRQVNIMPTKSVARKIFQYLDKSEMAVDDQKLFPLNNEFSQWVSSQDEVRGSAQTLRNPKSYKLKDIYYFFFNGCFLNSHKAEEDSKALLNCIIQCEKFWDWISKNAVTFNSIEPLF